MTIQDYQNVAFGTTLIVGIAAHLLEVKNYNKSNDELKKNATYWAREATKLQELLDKAIALPTKPVEFNAAESQQVELDLKKDKERIKERFFDSNVIWSHDGWRTVSSIKKLESIASEWLCPICGPDLSKTFKSIKALESHKSQMHDPQNHDCECGRSFTSKQGLGRHRLACKGPKDK